MTYCGRNSRFETFSQANEAKASFQGIGKRKNQLKIEDQWSIQVKKKIYPAKFDRIQLYLIVTKVAACITHNISRNVHWLSGHSE